MSHGNEWERDGARCSPLPGGRSGSLVWEPHRQVHLNGPFDRLIGMCLHPRPPRHPAVGHQRQPAHRRPGHLWRGPAISAPSPRTGPTLELFSTVHDNLLRVLEARQPRPRRPPDLGDRGHRPRPQPGKDTQVRLHQPPGPPGGPRPPAPASARTRRRPLRLLRRTAPRLRPPRRRLRHHLVRPVAWRRRVPRVQPSSLARPHTPPDTRPSRTSTASMPSATGSPSSSAWSAAPPDAVVLRPLGFGRPDHSPHR